VALAHGKEKFIVVRRGLALMAVWPVKFFLKKIK